MLTSPDLESSNPLNAITSVSILVKVKAKDLFPFAQNDQAKINLFTELSDGVANHVSKFGDPKDVFTTEVDLKTKVEWVARPNDPAGEDLDYSVQVTGYQFKPEPGSTSILGKTSIGRGPTGKVEGQVVDNDNLRKKEDVYAIKFTIHQISKNETKEFHMDPKLKVKPER